MWEVQHIQSAPKFEIIISLCNVKVVNCDMSRFFYVLFDSKYKHWNSNVPACFTFVFVYHM